MSSHTNPILAAARAHRALGQREYRTWLEDIVPGMDNPEDIVHRFQSTEHIAQARLVLTRVLNLMTSAPHTHEGIRTITLDLTYHRVVTISKCPDCDSVCIAVPRRRALQMTRDHLIREHGIRHPRRYLRLNRPRP